MCQLLALSANVPASVNFAFTGFSARGGRTADHADGFGLAFHDAEGCRVFIDETPASDAPLADFLRRHPYRARQVLAHVRRATQGPVRLVNCHPFVREWRGRHWTFCHNGDLGGFRPALDGRFLPVGQTDSEHAFCWLLQELARGHGRRRGAPEPTALAPQLAELAARAARHGAFNFLLCDGQALYAHASTRLWWTGRGHPFGTAELVDADLSLDLARANNPGDRMVLIATEPLTRNETWQPFAPGELRVFVAGEPVWQHLPQPGARLAPAPGRADVASGTRHGLSGSPAGQAG